MKETKMSEKCTDSMNRFLELDKHQAIPLQVSLHLLCCKKCRTQVRLMTMAERRCSEPLSVPATDSDLAIAMLMRKIDPSYTPELAGGHISMRRWIVSGIAMIFGMLFFLLSPNSMNNTTVSISFYIFFACAISAYCAIFVGSNMDFFVKKIETLNAHNLAIKN